MCCNPYLEMGCLFLLSCSHFDKQNNLISNIKDSQYSLFWQQYVTCAGKMRRNAHGLILSYRQKKWKMVEIEVFTEISSLSCLLAIPLLQIVIKHLKVSLFVCFLRGIPFFWSLLDDCFCFSPKVVGQYFAKRSILCEYSYRIGFFKSMLMKIKWSRWLTFAKRI